MKKEDLKRELKSEKILTENGAIAYASSGKELVDLNFAASSFRNMHKDEIHRMFLEAYREEPILALKWLFFLRDIRGGMGERSSFRVIISYLANEEPEVMKKLIKLIPEYGRWDDLLCLLETDIQADVLDVISRQFLVDMVNFKAKKPISLLAKWLPSINTSSSETKKYARIIVEHLFKACDNSRIEKNRFYSKTLSLLRGHLKVVEKDMSSNQWSNIDYEKVPSKANLNYKEAFMRHDTERRKAYLESVKKGDSKINASTLFAHDIVYKYWNYKPHLLSKEDVVLEELWKALPNYMPDDKSAIVVCDSSYSMLWESIGGNGTDVRAFHVAHALAIYMSERLTGEFKDCFITFSHKPKFVDMSNCKTLKDKLNLAHENAEVSNTDIYKVFKLILDTAIKNKYSQEELPQNIIICSDMEFDRACTCSAHEVDSLFEQIAREYNEHGYKMPRLTFWNICSRTKAIPLQTNENGVCLLSGFSQSIVDMAFSCKLDPYECLVEKLNSPRYQAIEDLLK